MKPPRHLKTTEFQLKLRAKWQHAGRRQECRCVLVRAQQARVPSGWAEKASDGDGRQIDRLHNLGQAQNYNINVDHGTTEPCTLAVARTSIRFSKHTSLSHLKEVVKLFRYGYS
jgi:hypothetical protein